MLSPLTVFTLCFVFVFFSLQTIPLKMVSIGQGELTSESGAGNRGGSQGAAERVGMTGGCGCAKQRGNCKYKNKANPDCRRRGKRREGRRTKGEERAAHMDLKKEVQQVRRWR